MRIDPLGRPAPFTPVPPATRVRRPRREPDERPGHDDDAATPRDDGRAPAAEPPAAGGHLDLIA